MDLSDITRLISSLRAQTARDSITPNGLGSILQRIVDAISSMSGIDVEDEEAILQRLSAAESNASTALQAAQNAQAGAANNVIDSFTHSQDEDEVSLSIKQHGHSARQVVLPAASSTGAGIMTATDKSHLDTAYGKRVNLMSAPSSESVVTLTITFGDGTTKSVTFVGATAGTGGKAGLMTKEQADQLAALVAAGTAESVRDDAGYLKQQYAAPVILRNVTDTVFDDLAIGDVYYDTGHLFYHAEGASGDLDIGAPSRKVIYYCLADQTLYRWTGSRFVQAVSISSGDVTVPTKLSDLVNDMGFLTAHQPLKTINGETITGTGNITIDGAAELKDASNHIKQSMATPVVLRNVTATVFDDLNEGDTYFDEGHLFYHTEGSSGDIDLGTPSKRLIYFCLANNSFYRWGGSSFTPITTSGGEIPELADVATSGSYNDLINRPTIPTTLAQLSGDSTHRVVTDAEKATWSGKQNALTLDDTPGNTDNPVKSRGIRQAIDNKLSQVTVNAIPAGSIAVEDNLGSDSDTNALSARQGKILAGMIDDIEQSGGGGIIISYNENTKTTTFTYGGNVQELSTSPTITVQNATIGKTATITHATALRLQYSIDSGTTWNDYTQPIAFTTAGTTVLLARAKESGKAWSEPSTATIVVEGTSQPTISKFSESDNNVTFKAALANATVYISTDGTTWTSGSGSVTLTVNKTTTVQSVTVYAKAKADGMLESSVATQIFEVAAKFQWEPNALGGTSNVALTKSDFLISGLCDADGANPTSAIADEDFSCVAIDGGYRWKILFPTESGSEITTLRGAKKSGSDYIYNLWGQLYSGQTNNKITSIDHMPDSITTLPKLCLSCLKAVGNITIGKNVATIATSVGASFVKTSTPSSFDIESGNSTFTTRSGILYKGNQLLQYPNGRPGTELQIEEGTTSIGTYAFEENRTLQKVILPSTITSLASSAAMTGMKEVREIIFNGTFSVVPQACCYDCTKLAKVTLPASVATIQGSVFYNAPLTEIHMLGSTPPNLLDTSTDTFKTHPTVYVPDAAAQAAYQANTKWVTVAGSTDNILVEPS